MRVLVTGASGFLGRHLIRGLASERFAGLAVSRGGTKFDLPPSWSESRRENVLRDTLIKSTDAVVHLEVKQHVFKATPEDRLDFATVNIEGTQAWLDWCMRHGVQRFLYFSSIKAVKNNRKCTGERQGARASSHGREEVGQKTEVQHERGGITESAVIDESAIGPNETPYGASKWKAEESVRAWVRQDSRRSALILRPAVIYGHGSTGNVAAMVESLRKGTFFLVGENANRKSLVSVGNVVAAVVHLLDRMQPGQCEVYNITDSETLSVRELDARIRRIIGKSGNSRTMPVRVARMAAKVGDVANRFGFSFPLTTQRVEALLETTHFSCAKLLGTGFVHPQTVDEGLVKMLAGSVG